MNKPPRKVNPFVLINCNQGKQELVTQEQTRESTPALWLPVFEDEVGYIGEAPTLYRVLKDGAR